MKPVLPDLEEFIRACRASMRQLSEDEFEEIAYIVYFLSDSKPSIPMVTWTTRPPLSRSLHFPPPRGRSKRAVQHTDPKTK